MIPAFNVDEAVAIVETLDGPDETWRLAENPVIARAMAGLARLAVDQAAELTAVRAQNAYLAPRQRAGQLVANAVRELDPVFYEHFRGDSTDPFNHDDRIEAYLRAWRITVAASADVTLRVAVRAYLAALATEQDAKAMWQRGAEGEFSDHNAEPYAGPLTDAYDAAIDARVAAFQALTEAAR